MFDRLHWQGAKTRVDSAYAGERRFLGCDSQMGQNLTWHARGRSPQRKVIVWTHLAHAEYRDPNPNVTCLR